MIAFLFPGQASQSVGMGKAWANESKIAASYFERANETLGRDLRKLCFEGPEEELTNTRNAQPAIYTVSCIAGRLLFDAGLVPDYVAGHSIGEYAALYFARTFDFETGLQLIQERADAMAEAGDARPGTMAAVILMEPEDIEKALKELRAEGGIISIAGLNSPGQTVISGSVETIEKAIPFLKGKGAKRVLPLSVSGAFHSELMRPAKERFEKALRKVALRKPSTLFVSNYDAKPVTEAEKLYEDLPNLLTSPVRWTEILAFMKDQGCQAYVEAGPGKVLSGLLKKFDENAPCAVLSDLDSIKKTAAEFHPYLCGLRKDYADLV
jgi:[acyl-carrier-protein] S-malonyltransferase